MDEEPKAPPEESEDSPEDPEYEAETPLDEEPEEPPEEPEAPPEEWEDDTEAPLDEEPEAPPEEPEKGENAFGLIYTRKRSCRTEGYREEVGRQRNAWKKRKWKWKKR